MDNVQLKQEDVFGEHAVLTDVNPVTNTKSIDDAANGEKLNQTLDRIWESINNKLSRIVNSVNGRTGVVVLTSDDVGLGNVDNVSFADIKSWVINQIENAFENKQLRLYDTYDRVIEAIDANDKTMSWAPFYCDMYGNNDRRAVIGVYTWDPSASHLGASYRMINTVGYADPSIIYRASQSDYNPGAPGEQDYEKYSDIPVGGIGVNIYKEERPDDQILYLEGARTGVPKGQAGLRLDHDKIGSRVYYEETPYGNVNIPADPNLNWTFTTPGMLWRFTDLEMKKGVPVKIYINDVEISPTYFIGAQLSGDASIADSFYLSTEWEYYNNIRQNDIIIMRFSNFTRTTVSFTDPYYCRTPVDGVCMDFNDRQPMIGFVTKFDGTDAVGTVFVIKFYDLKPNTIGYGITTYNTHQDGASLDTALGVKVLTIKGTPSKVSNVAVNMSGLNVQSLYNHGTIGSDVHRKDARYSALEVYTPWGTTMSNARPDGSLAIQTDETLCIQAKYQRKPTRYRLWDVPEWVANKFYKKEDDTYTLLTSRPSGWDTGWMNYYVKNNNDEYEIVKGVPPVYAKQDPTTGYGGIEPRDQYNLGSLSSPNYSWTRFTSETYYETLTENGVMNPQGSSPSDGLGGTISELGINFRKVSYQPDTGSSDYDGYTLHNLSGLKFYRVSDNLVASGLNSNYDYEFFHEIGIVDEKDALGKPVKNIFEKGGATAGVGVNVGKYLEITPKRNYRAETFWEGGKVQVRTAEGLTEKIETYDVTDYIKAGQIPSSETDTVPFTYEELKKRWLTDSDQFFAINTNRPDDLHPCRIRYISLDEKPDDWDEAWFKYLRNIGTDTDKDFVFLPVIDNLTIGFEPESQLYMGPYYRMTRDSIWGAITVDEVRNKFLNSESFNGWRIIWKRPTNRMTIDVDPNTLSFDTRGKLTVVGGVNSTETTNIRFIDSSGIYADTYSGDIDEAHTEGVRIGDGLKLNGTAITLPSDVVLLNSVESNTRLKSVVDEGMSAYELARFFYTFGDRFDITVPTTNTMTATWLRTQQPSLSDKIGHLPYVNVGNTKSDAKDVMSFNQSVHSALQRELNDRTEITFSDPTYNIPETSFVKGDLRTYMSGTISEVLTRATSIVRAIRTYVENPDDANKVEQYVANHYNLGTVASNDDLVEKLTLIPMFTDHHLEDHLPFDWLFSLFTMVILAKGKWSNIVAGEFRYTQLQHRPADWEPSGYASYFLHNTGSNVYEVLTPVSIEYHPGMFYIRNNETGEFSLVTDDTATQETILASYYFQNTFSLMTSDTEPANWTTDWTLYYTTSDETSAKRFSRVNTETPPTWEANKYYIMATNGDVVGYEKVTAAPPFENGEKGTTSNAIISAPDWEANTFYSDDQGTLTETRPDNWFTNYGDYYRKIGDSSYEHVSGYQRAFRTYTGPYYSRELVTNS
jgi:hypothetical protein